MTQTHTKLKLDWNVEFYQNKNNFYIFKMFFQSQTQYHDQNKFSLVTGGQKSQLLENIAYVKKDELSLPRKVYQIKIKPIRNLYHIFINEETFEKSHQTLFQQCLEHQIGDCQHWVQNGNFQRNSYLNVKPIICIILNSEISRPRAYFKKDII